jgi:hypothetical protein
LEVLDEMLNIPDTALTACPKVQFGLVRVGVACTGCLHFDGLSDRFPNGPQAFEIRYTVRCKHDPVNRTVTRLAEGL